MHSRVALRLAPLQTASDKSRQQAAIAETGALIAVTRDLDRQAARISSAKQIVGGDARNNFERRSIYRVWKTEPTIRRARPFRHKNRASFRRFLPNQASRRDLRLYPSTLQPKSREEILIFGRIERSYWRRQYFVSETVSTSSSNASARSAASVALKP